MRTQALDRFCSWLEQTPLSQAIQSAGWVVPTVQTIHILAIAAVLSSVLMLDLRLLGVVLVLVPVPTLALPALLDAEQLISTTAFDAAMTSLTALRARLAAAEDEWLTLEEKREALQLWAARLRTIVEPPPSNVIQIKELITG